MADEQMQEATITKAGEIHFPTWVKVVSSVMAACFPIGVGLIAWGLVEIVDMKVEVAEMKPKLDQAIASSDSAAKNRYTSADATADKALLISLITRNAQDIEELQQLHDRR